MSREAGIFCIFFLKLPLRVGQAGKTGMLERGFLVTIYLFNLFAAYLVMKQLWVANQG